MGAAAATCADVVLVTDDNPRSEDPAAIRAEVLAGAAVGHDRRRHRRARGRRPGRRDPRRRRPGAVRRDTVAVLGKGHESGQEVGGTVHPFDDRDGAARSLDRTTTDKEPA